MWNCGFTFSEPADVEQRVVVIQQLAVADGAPKVRSLSERLPVVNDHWGKRECSLGPRGRGGYGWGIPLSFTVRENSRLSRSLAFLGD